MARPNRRRKATSERNFGMSDKYVIKNCPNYDDYFYPNETCRKKYSQYCQDCTDCVLKQIYKLCKDDYTQFGDKELRYDTLEEIIKLLDIQEVEDV